MKKIINSPKAPKAIGPYSQAVEVNGTLYISGQLPIDASTGQICRRRYQRTNRTGTEKYRLHSGRSRIYFRSCRKIDLFVE